MRLNGWQRVWIVSSALYVLAAVPLIRLQLPYEGRYRAEAVAYVARFPEERTAMEELLAVELSGLERDRYIIRAIVLAGAVIPPLLFGAMFLVVAWVRRGFVRQRRGWRVVEAEIEVRTGDRSA